MNISPAERAAEFEGPTTPSPVYHPEPTQPPLRTRQFRHQILDAWTIPVQRIDMHTSSRYCILHVNSSMKNSSPPFLPALVSDVTEV